MSGIKPAIEPPKVGVMVAHELSFDYYVSCLTKSIFLLLWDAGKI